MLIVDGFATFFRVLVIGVGILTVLSSYRFLAREGAETGEFHALLLFSIAGQCVMVSANELIMIFIGLEISSISSYVLAGYLRDDKRANEAALKYFLLGSFATAFFLYGVAVVYGMTGSTYLTAIRTLSGGARGAGPRIHRRGGGADVRRAWLQSFRRAFPDLGAGRLPGRAHAGLGVPHHGAESRGLRHFPAHLHDRLSSPSRATGTAGVGIGAAVDDHRQLRRAHAIEHQTAAGYSSIAHAGYVLVALAAHSQMGTAAAMFYLAAYAFMNIGAFAVVSHLSGKGERFLSVDDFAGLGVRQPGTAALLTIFLLSLIGVPLTGGFFGKFYIFKAALEFAPGMADGARTVEQRGGGLLLSAHPGGDVYARTERSDSGT
jgi:NADH-quinone oxidoreductase subunit N